jgi:hypothetical protein
MQLKVLSWNLKYKMNNLDQIKLIRKMDADIYIFQEVHADFFRNLKKTGHFKWSAFSLNHRPPKMGENISRRMGCAVLGKKGYLINSKLLETVKFTERTLLTKVNIGGEIFRFCSFHIPPGATWKQVKPETMKKISQWLENKKERTIFGIDANTPRFERFNFSENVWWWKDERILMGENPTHNLRDVYREYLKNDPILLEKIKDKRPEGPLAISYQRGTGNKVYCRYDFIYTTHDLTPLEVDYLYNESLIAGSDHSLIITRLLY